MGMGRFRKNFEALRDHGCNCHLFAIGSIYSNCRDWGANKVGGESLQRNLPEERIQSLRL